MAKPKYEENGKSARVKPGNKLSAKEHPQYKTAIELRRAYLPKCCEMLDVLYSIATNEANGAATRTSAVRVFCDFVLPKPIETNDGEAGSALQALLAEVRAAKQPHTPSTASTSPPAPPAEVKPSER